MSFAGTPQPRPRWYHARTELDDFAIVSYRVSTDALIQHLPPGFTPMRMTFADGRPGTLISAVAFRDRDFHFRFLPQASINCGQINYRAYVTANDKPGVWFFATTLDHPVVAIPQHLWGMPWSRAHIRIAANWTAAPAHWRLEAGDTHCDATELPKPLTTLDGFTDESDWLERLTHPTQGWYRRRNGRIGAYTIWHPVMRPRHLTATTARFPLFERLGLITPDTPPHSILAQPHLSFDIHTPPHRFHPT
ncbi:DUF2071 domain-containing protein [Nonomuraea purpurea]|uniref:DUF2071 domain-containing protein n=1 Tax=Nonomuraea purpurea TaxID=1849276 RepID=A0ABV8G0E0_9ACTN